MAEIEVGLWYDDDPQGMCWKPYRPPVRFDGLGEFQCCFIVYRCGQVEITGSFMAADHGSIIVKKQRRVADFMSDLARYPVFVLADGDDYLGLVETAADRRIPHHCFANGIGFRSTSEALMAKLRTP